MKHLFYIAGALMVSLALQAQPKEWENQRVNQINREPIHAHFIPFSSEKGYIARTVLLSEWNLEISLLQKSGQPSGYFL